MFLRNIKLTNFRNYNNLDFTFSTPVTVLVGDNAQGKSNFLESIYYLATTKSSKAEEDRELVNENASFVFVEGKFTNKFQNPTEETSLEIGIQLEGESLSKRVRVNGVPRRVLDYIGNLSVVLFSPEDINLVTGSPSLRRWHVDITLAQIDREYKNALTKYGEVVTKRNRVLKNIQEGLSSIDELIFWTDQLLSYGEVVSKKRKEFFDFLNITEHKFGEFEFKLKANILTKERLVEYQSREIASATSLIGPHRDDFEMYLNGKNVAKFGSRGEHRTAILDLKVAEVLFIEKKLGSRPVLLLDDVFSELDLAHQKHVLDLVGLQQTVIATVELDEYLREYLGSSARIIQVKAGKFSE